ncbi:tautomerase family protein [Flagellimonas zhangzhouensis]|uniref:Tautomerase enzyme n=1 Tax=Flagellimonas zhangzhouensis TaxID=1073328 RepID=A0A1H2YM67_9FLAO|nr:tautomerase family protein [Allomuricauda zhangzhouensis]SDR01809.1 4-oxalocrotonate tautomerase family enzyme [Allomuricauda zhangzhouensis]SDX06091.1 Tautomerase enzyme [Allomuricauda zhangzhouensis]
MPHFQINLLEGKSEEQKKELVAEVIKAAQKVVGMGDDSYSVALEEYSTEEWKNEVYPNKIMANEEILVKKLGYTM